MGLTPYALRLSPCALCHTPCAFCHTPCAFRPFLPYNSAMNQFTDRKDAGRQLAESLQEFAGQPDLLVLALPRGGVPVAFEVARELEAPLDLCLVRKLGVPGQEELAFGAIAAGGIRFLNEDIVRELGLTRMEIEAVVARETAELARREKLYRGSRTPSAIAGQTVIIVDDGLATGATMHAAVRKVLTGHPRRIIVAVPVAARETYNEFSRLDPLISCRCLNLPDDFQSVGLWYEDFSQTTDEEVLELLSI